MPPDQFQKGLANIQAALETALGDRGIKGASVRHDSTRGETRDVEFVVNVQDKSQAQTFIRQEIEDSGEAIDAPVAVKVRMLVSHFVR